MNKDGNAEMTLLSTDAVKADLESKTVSWWTQKKIYPEYNLSKISDKCIEITPPQLITTMEIDAGIREKLDKVMKKLSGRNSKKVSHNCKDWVYRTITAILACYGQDDPEWVEEKAFLKRQIMEDFRFMYLYIVSDYAADPLGKMPHYNFLSIIGLHQLFFSEDENSENVAFLKRIALEWEATVKTENHTDQQLKIVSEETRQRLREELEPHSGDIDKKELEKLKLLLFYKYIYLRGLEIFQLSPSHYLHLNGTAIAFDFDSYVHLGRHLAKGLREVHIGKTYFKEMFDLNTFELLKVIFDEINLHERTKEILLNQGNNSELFFEVNGIVYSAWIDPSKGKPNKETQFRLSSIYPAEKKNEIERYSSLERTQIKEDLYFYF
jgi:hypothetical protein